MSRNLIWGCVAIAGVMLMFVLAACVAIDFAARHSRDMPMFGGHGRNSTGVDMDQYDDPVDLGEAIYSRNCSGCHSIDGSSRAGPTFRGLFDSQIEMDDGSIVIVDEAHVRQAITDPRATTRQGYPDIMPSFSNLDDEELDALVAFIRSLR